MMMIVIYSFLLTVPLTSAKCPASCQCYVQSNIHSIFCIRASLDSIPNSFDFDVKILNFTGNHIPVLTNEFLNPYFRSLEIVDLKDNGIEIVTNKALHKLKNLLEIDLSANRIRTINGKIFAKNRFLNTIILSGNPLKEIKDDAFPASIFLRRLDLQACRLNKIHTFAFVNTPLLEELNVKDNALKSIPTNVMHLTQLGLLSLDGNPLKCDENLWHLLRWLRGKNSTFVGSLLCVYGETENAIFWDTMDVNDPAKFQSIRDKRAIVIAASGEKARSTKRIAAAKTTQHERTLLPPKRDTFSTPRTSLRYFNNCTQSNEYSPGKAYKNPDENVTAANVTADKNHAPKREKEKNTPPLWSPPSKNNNQTRPVRYNNAQIVRNFVEQPRNYQETAKSWDKTMKSHRNNKFDQDVFKTLVVPSKMREFGQYGNSDRIYQRRVNDEKMKIMFSSEGTPSERVNYSYVTSGETFNHTDTENNAPQYQYTYDDHHSDEGNFFEENYKIVFAVELIIIVILLFVLHWLWKESQRRSEAGANVPLNNAGKKTKSYDSQISGYKRYSLSDEDFSDIRDNHDEGKYDAESGYLSYHRYNSIEGENNNDYPYHCRRYNGNDDHRGHDFEDADTANGNFQPDRRNGNADSATNNAMVSRRNSNSRTSRHEHHSIKSNGSRSNVEQGPNRSSDEDNNN